MSKFHQTLLDDEALAYIKAGKVLLSKESGKRVSYSEVIKRYVGKEVRIQRLQPEIRHYIEGYCFGLSIDERVMGIVLFGSYARGTETEWSDIDLFIVFKGTFLEGLKLFSNMDKNLQRDRDRIVKDERYPYMSPFFVDTEGLYDLNPIYFDIMDYGIVLFQRENTISDFYKWLNIKNHRRDFRMGQEVLSWTE